MIILDDDLSISRLFTHLKKSESAHLSSYILLKFSIDLSMKQKDFTNLDIFKIFLKDDLEYIYLLLKEKYEKFQLTINLKVRYEFYFTCHTLNCSISHVMSIHLAGGIRNPKSTSYINCALQLLLHFHPFLELLEIQADVTESSLIKILFNLANKIHTTDNSISADNLISFFKIDPNFFSDIVPFIKQLIQSLPSEYNSIIKINDLNSFGTNDIEPSNNDNSKMFVFYVDPSHQPQTDIDELIIIGDNKYILFSIVQFSGNINIFHNGHYSILIRDNQGWIQCNDTSVIAIQDESQIGPIIHDEKTPFELLAYISSLDLIDFNRRSVSFSNPLRSSPIANSDSSTKNSPITKKTGLFPPLFSNNNNRVNIFETNIVTSSSSDSPVILDNHDDDRLCKSLICKFFDGKIMKIVKEKELTINSGGNYKDTAEKLKKEWKNEFHDDLEYKFFVNSNFVEKTPDMSTENVSAIYERRSMPIFNNSLINETAKLITIELVILGTPVVFKAQFVEQQTVNDIKSYVEVFQSEILNAKKTNISIFSIFNEKVLNISEKTQIKKIKQILETDDLQFAITFNNSNPDELATIKVPLFKTENHFSKFKEINIPIEISDTGKTLLDKARDLNERPLQIIQFNSQTNNFLPVNSSDYLFNIVNLENIRIQKRIETNEIPFIPKNNLDLQPFSYPLIENQTLDSLTKEIKKYIDSDSKIVLEYNKESKNVVKIPLKDFQNGIFSFMYINIKS